MKKRFLHALIIIIACSCLLSLSGCSNIEEHGIDAIGEGYVTKFRDTRFPSDDFLQKFEYINGNCDFTYRSNIITGTIWETSFVYLEYDTDVYEQAKQFSFDNLPLTDEVFGYNNYVFYENILWVLKLLHIENYSIPLEMKEYSMLCDHITLNGTSLNYPSQSVFFGYNDEKHILIFAYVVEAASERISLLKNVKEDTRGFLNKIFPWYDFDA